MTEAMNDQRLPYAAREDLRLGAETLRQLLPAAPAAGGPGDAAAAPAPIQGTWMGASGMETPTPPVQENLQNPATVPLRRSDMQCTLAQWLVDAGGSIERLNRQVGAGEGPLHALLTTMSQQVQNTTELGRTLHMQLADVVNWYLALKDLLQPRRA